MAGFFAHLINRLRARVLKNPHFWVVVAMSTALLLVYQAWPWREWQFQSGFWRYFSWLSTLDPVVTSVELKYHLIGVFFLVPIIYGSLALSWQGGIFAWALSLIWLLPTLMLWSTETLLINLTLLLMPALVMAIITSERRWRESERRYFAERERERQAYVARLVETQEGERRRIAQEIHDGALQTLMVVANKSDVLASTGQESEQGTGNRWIKQEVLRTMDDLRRLSMNLRPSILDNFGLVSGLRWLVNNANSQKGAQFKVVITGEERQISELVEVTVFRVAQEAINNIQRHARAKCGTVSLDFRESSLQLTVEDDGVGFQMPDRLAVFINESKLGIIGMEQRLLSVEGSVQIESKPGAGTRLLATIPC